VEADLSAEADGCLDVEARHALYRVVQQALDNVAAHAEANRVVVTIATGDGRVRFAIVDDGQGFSAEDRAAARERGSFGLKSMYARITSVGGDVSTDSTPGKGTRISGWLPAGAPRTLSIES
jgi:signal transduction histidine kinase